MIDFDYVRADMLEKGMMINYTSTKNEDAENFLVFDAGETVSGSFWARVLNADGELTTLMFSIGIDGSIPKVRVYPEEDPDAESA